jgi:hypothetical protein
MRGPGLHTDSQVPRGQPAIGPFPTAHTGCVIPSREGTWKWWQVGSPSATALCRQSRNSHAGGDPIKPPARPPDIPGRLPRRHRRGSRPPVRRAGRCVPPPRMNRVVAGHDPTSHTCVRASSATVTAWSEFASTRARDAGGRGRYPQALLSFIAAGVARHADGVPGPLRCPRCCSRRFARPIW